MEIIRDKEVYKRYIVFIYDEWTPSGGMDDVSDSFDTLAEAIEHTEANFPKFNTCVILDRIEGVKYKFEI